MAHNTRTELPKNWPMPRKGTKYFIVANHENNKAMPLLMALRDVLNIVKTRREARYMLLNKEISINGQMRRDEKFPVRLFDIITLEKTKKNYRLNIVGKKIKFEEVSGKDAGRKIVRIIGKVLISKDKTQMNLEDGTNFIVKEKFNTGDSAVISLKENKIEKMIPMKEGAKVLIVGGKHSGKQGEVLEVLENKEFIIKFEDGEVKLPLKTLLVVN
jgi:small subunit ribosomal protein S4e